MADQIAFTSTAADNQMSFDSSEDKFTSVSFEGQVSVGPQGPPGPPGPPG